jgi:hypothetical protein
MSPPHASSSQPVASYEDVSSPRGLLALNLLALAYLAGSFFLGLGIEELDVVAASLVGGSALIVALGPRRIEAGPAGLQVWRWGRPVLRRPLEDFVRLEPGLLGLQRIRLRDGRRLWFAGVGPEATRLIDYLHALPQVPVAAAGRSRRGDELELPVAAVRFPRGHCVVCGRTADASLTLEARRGFSLVLVSHFLTRALEVPGCGGCRWRRRLAGAGANGVLVLLGAWALFGLRVVPVGQVDPLQAACAALGLVGLFALQNRGDVWLDHRVYGVSARGLSADGARVRLRVRSAALREALSREARAPGPLRAQGGEGLGLDAG